VQTPQCRLGLRWRNDIADEDDLLDQQYADRVRDDVTS
jgi:hypothetical protein